MLSALCDARGLVPILSASSDRTSSSEECHFTVYVEFVAHCRAQGCLRYWEPVGYRTSVIRGRPNEGFRCGWEELRRVCPDWPGFREERYDESLRAELERQEAEEP